MLCFQEVFRAEEQVRYAREQEEARIRAEEEQAMEIQRVKDEQDAYEQQRREERRRSRSNKILDPLYPLGTDLQEPNFSADPQQQPESYGFLLERSATELLPDPLAVPENSRKIGRPRKSKSTGKSRKRKASKGEIKEEQGDVRPTKRQRTSSASASSRSSSRTSSRRTSSSSSSASSLPFNSSH
jgi:hypothetical protein